MGTPVTVLVVDDAESIRSVYELTLAGIDGIEVVMREGVPEARAYLPGLLESGRRVVAILDGNIGAYHGRDFAAEIRSLWGKAGRANDLVIIACSADSPVDWGDEGCNFKKPFDISEIEACVLLGVRQVA